MPVIKILTGIIFLIMASTSFAGVCGDVNGNGTVDLLDVSGIIGSLYRGGTLADWVCGDVNGDEKLNLLDVSDIINHLCGYHGITGQYDSLGYSGYIWYSPSVNENIAMLIRMDYNSADLYFGETDKHKGFSVRCVKD
jgi:hypothetical protein